MLKPDHIDFLLVPDAPSGRRVRKAVATRNLGFGVKVGTCLELVEAARLAFVIPPLNDDWYEIVRRAIEQGDDGFWQHSYRVDPVGTASEIAGALEEIIRSGETHDPWLHEALPRRASRILADLRKFWSLTGEVLPPELNLIREIRASPGRAISRIAVYRTDGWPRLDTWQAGLVNSLNEAAGELNPIFFGILEEVASLPVDSEDISATRRLASLCFSGRHEVFEPNAPTKFLVARDPLQEVECAVGLAQVLLDRGAQSHEIGFLVPDDPYYLRYVQQTLSKSGNLTSGLPSRTVQRDLAGEVVRSLLLLARGPAPKMALASLLASPLAPWPNDVGAELASDVMAGRFDLRAPKGMRKEHESRLSVIRRLKGGHASILDAIDVFTHATDDADQLARLQSLTAMITNHSEGQAQIDYDALFSQVGQAQIVIEAAALYPANGVVILDEAHEPWTTVEHLIVLGFNSGRYPASPAFSPVLHEAEKQAINEHLGWSLQTAQSLLAMRREKFQRQLASAKETITFFASARNIDGNPIQPAETATFMAGLFGKEVEELFVPVEKEHGLLPRAAESAPTPPRRIQPRDLDLGRNLISNGNERRESPSSLETLLVSPLAWLLGRLAAEPDPWAPDTMDALLQGNLAHAVFESIFAVDANLLERDAVEEAVDAALADAIRNQAPLLATAQWKVERHNLRGTLIQAASRWRDVLKTLNARVVAVEARLTGHLDATLIRGFCDEVLELPGGKLVVVDFKKSTSPKRRDRMSKGYDCQVSLYESMLRQNGKDLGLNVSGAEPGIVYFTLNDQVVLADDRAGLPTDLPGLAVVSNDVSEHALEEIAERLEKLSVGTVEMNREDDARRLDKEKSLPGYALQGSPLIMMFAHQVADEGS